VLLIRILHQLNDEAPDVIDLLSVVRPWCDPQVGIFVVVPRRLEVEMQGHAWEFAGSALYDPLGDLFDMQIQIRMGQANVRQWTDDIIPLLTEDDVLKVEDLKTHTMPLDDAPHGYEIFQKKEDGCIKVVLEP